LTRALFHNRGRRAGGQAIFVFMLGLAVVALILANVFLVMEYLESFHDKNDVLKAGQDSIAKIKSMKTSKPSPAAPVKPEQP